MAVIRPFESFRFGASISPNWRVMVKREVGFGELEPRSHSLVVRATGNRVGPFPREFKSLSRRQTTAHVETR